MAVISKTNIMGKTDTSTFIFRKFEPKDFPALVIIFQKAFGKKVTIDYLKRKYDSTSLGIDSISAIAFDGDIPIGVYGAIPQLFKDGNEEFLIAHACDSFTIPGYQKKGVHYNLALVSYDLMRKCQIKMVYAYHSENTYYSTKKLDWKEHIPMERFHVSAAFIPLSKIFNKIGLNHVYQRFISKKLAAFKCTPEQNPFEKEDKIYHNYSESFYQYKSGFYLHHCIKVNNCFFYLKVDSIMKIGHVNFSDAETLKKGVQALIQICKSVGISEILFQTDPSSKLNEALCSIYDSKPSWLIGYLLFDESLEVNRIGFNFSELDTF